MALDRTTINDFEPTEFSRENSALLPLRHRSPPRVRQRSNRTQTAVRSRGRMTTAVVLLLLLLCRAGAGGVQRVTVCDRTSEATQEFPLWTSCLCARMKEERTRGPPGEGRVPRPREGPQQRLRAAVVCVITVVTVSPGSTTTFRSRYHRSKSLRKAIIRKLIITLVFN